MMRFVSITAAAVLVLTGLVSGAVAQEAELFEKAYGYYLSSQPDKAVEAFDSFLREFPESSAGDAALFWKAKALILLKKTEAAIKIFSGMEERFPDSYFKAFARGELEMLKHPGPEANDKKKVPEEEIKEPRDIRAEDADGGVQDQEAAQGKPATTPAKCDGQQEAELQKLRGERDALQKRLGELEDRLKPYETPVVRIGENRYSLFRIIEENIISSRVLSRMGIVSVPWKRCDPYEDFVIEQILSDKARDEGIKEDNEPVSRLADNFSFGERERAYLTKYLMIDALIGKKTAAPGIDEKDIRDYYESNREKYLIDSGGKFVGSLIINYTKEEPETSSLADKIYHEAVKGKSFENIYASQPDKTVLTRSRFEDLPAGIKERAGEMKDGEITRIAEEDQFIILQMQIREPSYREYGDVREEIRGKLISGKRVSLREWLDEIRKEAEEIK